MCSTPRTSGNTLNRNSRSKSFDADTLRKYAEVANAAEERRERQRQQAKAQQKILVRKDVEADSNEGKPSNWLEKIKAALFSTPFLACYFNSYNA